MLPPMPKTVILGAARTPFGKMGGGLSSLDATDLGGTAIAAALERAEVAPDQVEHVVFGQVLQAGQGQIPSRQAQIKGGIPKEVSSETVNKVCASGLRSAGMVDQAVRAGDLDVAVAGGMESMSNAPYLLKQARFGYRMGDAKTLDAMMHDGLTNPFSGKHMGEEADEVGDELEITRADMDKFALRSHELAVQATDEGRLPEEIVPVTVNSRKGDTVVEVDEAPRRETSLEALVQAARRLQQGGLAHRRQRARRERRRRRAGARQRRVGQATTAGPRWPRSSPRPRWPTTSPTWRARPPTPRSAALEKAGLSVDDIDLFEINEAFASVALNSMRMLERGRVEGERERRRDRARPPDRRLRRAHPDDAGERAAPPRRRARRGGHLLRRRPGRRGDHRGQWRLSLAAPPSSTSTRP